MKKILLPALALFVLISFSSCKEKLYNQLEGDWKATSVKEDGDELLGSDLTGLTLEFDDYSADDDEGDFSWTFSDDIEDYTESGTYEVDSEDAQVKIIVTDGTDSYTYNFDVEVDGDELTLEGNIDGSEIVIEAERD